MTLTETSEAETVSMDINTTFKEVLIQAARKGRVSSGLYTCAKELQTSPERVLVCVLPVDDGSDDLLHMQHVLLEAYCREYKIKVLKVENTPNLEKLLREPGKKRRKLKDLDFSCILIQVAKEGKTNLEQRLLHSCRVATEDVIIQIPAV